MPFKAKPMGVRREKNLEACELVASNLENAWRENVASWALSALEYCINYGIYREYLMTIK